MTREEVYERLNGVFREILDDDSIELHDETVADDVDGWDSFEHINLIVGVEEEFGFKIPMGKVVTMKECWRNGRYHFGDGKVVCLSLHSIT